MPPASRVNKKFVLILSSTLLVLGSGVTALAYFAAKHSAADHIATADKWMQRADELQASGDTEGMEEALEKALKHYSNAVYDDNTNTEYLRKWAAAVQRDVPELDTEYAETFESNYRRITSRLASLEPNNVKTQQEWLTLEFDLANRQDVSSRPAYMSRVVERAEIALDRLDPNPSPALTGMIRGYMGRAMLDRAVFIEASEKDLQAIWEHLAASAAVAPEDVDIAIAQLQWHSNTWSRTRSTAAPEDDEAAWLAATEFMRTLASRFPGHPMIDAAILHTKAAHAGALATPNERSQAVRAFFDGHTDTLARIAAADPAQLTPDHLSFLGGVLRTGLEGADKHKAVVGLFERYRNTDPTNAMVLLQLGRALLNANRFTEAQEVFAVVEALPSPPVSLEGLFIRQAKSRAVYEQADAALTRAEAATTDEARNAALRDADAATDRLIAQSAELEVPVDGLILRARRQILSNRHLSAAALLQRVSDRSDADDTDRTGALWLLGYALERAGQLGAARGAYDDLLTISPKNDAATLRAATLDIKLNDAQRARYRLEALVRANPYNTEALRLLDAITISDGPDDAESIAAIRDPGLRAIREASRLVRTDGDTTGALELLRSTLDSYPEDTRLLLALADTLIRDGNPEEAADLAERLLTLLPSNARARRIQALAEHSDPLDAAFALIDEDAPDATVALVQKSFVMRRRGDTARFEEFLAAAIESDPTHPAVLDTRFQIAAMEGNIELASSIAEAAIAANADSVGGLYYRARLALLQDRAPASLDLLREALALQPYDSRTRLFFAEALRRTDQTPAAVATLGELVRDNPSNALATKLWIQGLLEIDRVQDALTAARKASVRHTQNPEILNLWLNIESRVGDRDLSIERMRSWYAIAPEYKPNAQRLARLLAENRELDEAAEIAKELARIATNDEDSLVAASILTTIDGYRGSLTSGVSRLESLADTASTPSHRVSVLLRLADHLYRFDDPDGAFATLSAASASQAPGDTRADAATATLLTKLGRAPEAINALERVLANASDDRRPAATLQLAKALLAADRFSQARTLLQSIDDGSSESVRMQRDLLRIDAANQEGDKATAQRLLNETVAAFPDKASPFYARAVFYSSQDDQRDIAIADARRAIELAPRAAQARVLLADLYWRERETKKSLETLVRGTAAIPDSFELLQQLTTLQTRTGQQSAALLSAERAADSYPHRADFLSLAGDLQHNAAQAERDLRLRDNHLSQAVERYDSAFVLQPSTTLTLAIADSLLAHSSPSVQDTDRAASLLAQLPEAVSQQPLCLLLNSRLMFLRGNQDGARAAANTSLQSLTSAADLSGWMQKAKSLHPSLRGLDFITELDALEPPASLLGAYQVITALELTQTPGGMRPATERLESLVANSSEHSPEVVSEAFRVLGTLLHTQENYAGAVDAFRQSLKSRSNNPDVLNNLAYIQAVELGQIQEGLRNATAAIKLVPNNASYLDTLGAVHLLAGTETGDASHFKKARDALDAGLALSPPPSLRVPLRLHRAAVELRAPSGNLVQARQLLNLVREALDLFPDLKYQYDEQLQELIRESDRTE